MNFANATVSQSSLNSHGGATSIFSDHCLDANGEEFVFEDIIAELDFYGEAAAKEFNDWTKRI